MKLQKDRDAFQALLSVISEKTGIREDIIEKDYYLTLLLSELSVWQSDLPAYFKQDRQRLGAKAVCRLFAFQVG